MKYLTSFIILFSLAQISGYSQTGKDKYWIAFTDKNSNPYNIQSPQIFLSARAIERRINQNIPITEQDLPVTPQYMDSLKKLGLEILYPLKWLNGAVITTSNSVLIDTLQYINFIAAKPKLIEPGLVFTNERKFKNIDSCNLKATIDYGYSENQIKMLEGNYLHEQGYEGSGKLIVILDAGFLNANTISSLQHLFIENKIIATKDFVDDGVELYQSHNHGTHVLSIIGGEIPSKLHGTAIDADFALIRTENGSSEYPIEEYNWVAGAEYADSIGADVINSSLGYFEFDDPSMSHTYSDMDGKTNVSTLGADIAVAKGIMVIVSAGNEGDNTWKKIISPADAFNVLTIGALDPNKVITNFSSIGPSADGRIKPDICAQGLATASQSPNGQVSSCNGTSCSAPVITGLVTCLWQANPRANVAQIRRAIIESSSLYANPDTIYGYGIPNFSAADVKLKEYIKIDAAKVNSITIYPNPNQGVFSIEVIRPQENIFEQEAKFSFYDLTGRLISSDSHQLKGQVSLINFDMAYQIPQGLIFVKIEIETTVWNKHLVILH